MKVSTDISRAEAEEILELNNSYTAEDVKKNYRRLIRVAHPDNGGSEEQARIINNAKDVIDKMIANSTNTIFYRVPQNSYSTPAPQPSYTTETVSEGVIKDFVVIIDNDINTQNTTTSNANDPTSNSDANNGENDNKSKEPKWYRAIYDFMEHPIIWRLVTTTLIMIYAMYNMLTSQLVSLWSGLDILFDFFMWSVVALVNLITGFTYKILFIPIRFIADKIYDIVNKYTNKHKKDKKDEKA